MQSTLRGRPLRFIRDAFVNLSENFVGNCMSMSRDTHKPACAACQVCSPRPCPRLQPACSPETLSLDFQQLLGAFDFSTDGPLAVMPGDHAADASHADSTAAVGAGWDVAGCRALPATQQGPIISLPDLAPCNPALAGPAPAPYEHWEAAFDLPGHELWQQLQQGCQPALPHWHTQHWGVTRRSL